MAHRRWGRRAGRSRPHHRRDRLRTWICTVPDWPRSRVPAASGCSPNAPRSSTSGHPAPSAVAERPASCGAPTDGSPCRWRAPTTSRRSRRGSASTPATTTGRPCNGAVADSGVPRGRRAGVALGLACAARGRTGRRPRPVVLTALGDAAPRPLNGDRRRQPRVAVGRPAGRRHAGPPRRTCDQRREHRPGRTERATHPVLLRGAARPHANRSPSHLHTRARTRAAAAICSPRSTS